MRLASNRSSQDPLPSPPTPQHLAPHSHFTCTPLVPAPHPQALRDLALSKAHELEALCLSSRIPPPLLGPLLTDLERPGAATGVLSRLVRLVAEVAGLAAKRAPVLAQVG